MITQRSSVTDHFAYPSSLAPYHSGAPPDIPGKATLVFDVKLVEIK